MAAPQSLTDLTVNIRAAVLASIEDADASGASATDRPVVLRAILNTRLGGTIPRETSSTPSIVVGDSSTLEPIDDSDVLGKISARMKLDRDVLELVYDVQDGVPNVVLSGKKLPDNKSQATKILAQLIVGARQAAGLEEWTPVGEVRAVANEYGRLDSANFAAQIQQLDKVSLLRGKGANREIKVTKPGMEDIATLITSLAGGTQ